MKNPWISIKKTDESLVSMTKTKNRRENRKLNGDYLRKSIPSILQDREKEMLNWCGDQIDNEVDKVKRRAGRGKKEAARF